MAITPEDAAHLDRVLRFAPSVAARYEAERGAARVADLRRAIFVGILVYNVYNLTSIVLLPDILTLSVLLRLLVMTPTSLLIAAMIGGLRADQREALVTAGIVGAYLIPLFLFWLSQAPLGAYTFGELVLTLVFGNMLLTLRFSHAVAFTAVAMAATVAALLTKAGLDAGLRDAFLVQGATSCLFTLYANRRAEALRCRSYLEELDATLRSEAAEIARREYRDLSMTDALTGLPNRRALAAALEHWFATPRAVAVMMIDVDHFKLFNDARGHQAGDTCLRAVAATLADFAREDAVMVARFGGEEFTLVALDLDEARAIRLAGAVVKAVERLRLAHPGRRDGVRVVTVSVGVALTSGDDGAPVAAVLEAADRALYEAKRQGRNRCASAGDADCAQRASA